MGRPKLTDDKRMEQIAVSLPPQVVAQAKATAEARFATVAQVVRELVMEGMKHMDLEGGT